MDSKTRFLSAKAEYSVRLGVRGNINISHIQVVLAAVGTYLLAKINSVQGIEYAVAAIMPLISAYFILYYEHNDRIIGVLELYAATLENLGKNESLVANVPRYHDPRQLWQNWSSGALDRAHIAIGLLSIISPILLATDALIGKFFLGSPVPTLNSTSEEASYIILYSTILWCLAVSAWNIYRIITLNKFRKTLANDYQFNFETMTLKLRA